MFYFSIENFYTSNNEKSDASILNQDWSEDVWNYKKITYQDISFDDILYYVYNGTLKNIDLNVVVEGSVHAPDMSGKCSSYSWLCGPGVWRGAGGGLWHFTDAIWDCV